MADQSEARHLLCLPVIDCPQFDADLRGFVQAKPAPTAAELAAKVLASHAPTAGPVTPVPVWLLKKRDSMRAEMRNPCAAQQWLAASPAVRALLVADAGLRNPTGGPGMPAQRAMADRGWGEFAPDEQRAVAQSVRVLLRDLMQLHCIARER